MNKLLQSLLTLTLPLLIILFSTSMLIYNLGFYSALFDKNNVDGKEGVKVTKELFDYFKGISYAPPSYFSDEEKIHLAEVREIWQWLSIIFPAALFLWVILLVNVKDARRVFLNGSILALLLLFLIAIVPFSYSFEFFHKSLFTQAWKFPLTSALVSIYPEGFFYDFASMLWVNSAVIGILLAVVCLTARKKSVRGNLYKKD